MVSIEDCSSKRLLPQPLKGAGGLPEDSESPAVSEQETNKENQVPIILAKAAVAVKMQIVAGLGNRDQAARRPDKPSGRAEDSVGVSIAQGEFDEDNMVRNLKGIVADDRRWELFALGALGLQPGTGSCETLRDCLLKGFKEDSWDGIANLVALYSQNAPHDEETSASAPSEDISTGLIERTKLWLTFSDYFETLFRAIKEKNLPSNLDLYSDERLIKYLRTIGQ